MEVKHMTEVTTTVWLADSTGHSELELTRDQTMDLIQENEGHWVYAGNQMVQPAQLAEADWDDVGIVQIVPSLQGGH
jgi:hypothetical protein|tara:strand:+ start:102 stop:332 length:231 start_codon:yes stop_codon:yes gene_type:complete